MKREAKAAPAGPSNPDVNATIRDETTLEEQIKAARCELARRRDLYPSLVVAKRMTLFRAQDDVRVMAAILKTLEGLRTRG